MILFEFVCNSCGKEFEELVSSEKEQVRCPHCGSGDVRRLLSAARCKITSSSPVSTSTCAPAGGFS